MADKQKFFDYIKSEVPRMLGSLGSGAAYYAKGPEAIEGTYKTAEKAASKVKSTISESYVKIKENATTKNLIKVGVAGLATALSFKGVDHAYESKEKENK
ncbi:hypothetical protein K9L67_01845 [Candidatus Woesearchaeota archaeon]|nr:hypothetical protein [Candidatus Woesearchaeota archaeon]MCF7900947.1 hypothetical protein [Candidatus Woesearchaeota archaeon]MCF8013607.1 hypothetical protein [Candidatus Woesearchaeota archaeon]